MSYQPMYSGSARTRPSGSGTVIVRLDQRECLQMRSLNNGKDRTLTCRHNPKRLLNLCGNGRR